MANRYSLSNDRGRSPLIPILRVIIQFVVIIFAINIAFQIQNRNEKRKTSLSQTQYLQALQSEAIVNLKGLTSVNQNRKRQVVLLEKLIAAASRTVSDDTVRLAVDELLRQNFYSASSAAYDNLVASGNLNSISSDSIRASLSAFKRLQNNANLIDATDNKFIAEQLEPYLTKRQVIYLLELKTSNTRADLTISNQQTGRIIKTLLQDRTFIDLIYLRMNRINQTIEANDPIRSQLTRIIEELDLEMARTEE